MAFGKLNKVLINLVALMRDIQHPNKRKRSMNIGNIKLNE
jgi:hypothetical protein